MPGCCADRRWGTCSRREWLGPEETFNYEIFKKNWVDRLRVAEPNYLAEQSDELLALILRDLM
ncbi:MAG: hypothetical protein ABFS41_13200, partial [Myxococcota bacterium]